MPRLLGKLPAYRKHKATGQALVTLGGRDYYLGRWQSAASKAEYNRVTREWLAGGVAGSGEADEITVNGLLAAFLRHAKGYYRGPDGTPTSELGSYRTLIERLKPMYGKTPALEFGPLRLKAFRQSLVDERLSRGVINRTISRVRQIFRWGAENELISARIVDALRCVAGLRYGKSSAKETEPIGPVADAVVDATLPHLSPQVRAMVELQRLTGMRSGEVCQMRTGDINTKGSTWTYSPAEHKTKYRGHSRIVYLGPKSQEILRPWLRMDLKAHLFQPAEAVAWRREQIHTNRKTPIAYGNRPGTNRKRKSKKVASDRYSSNSYGRSVRAGCESAFGMPSELRRRRKSETSEQRQERNRLATEWRREYTWHPHQLRHSAATYFRREYGLEVARVLLGHRHAAITEIYAEADQQRAIEVVAKIG